MPVWKFEVQQSGRGKVQSVGLRPFIVSQMLECGFERGDAINSPDGRSVSVLLECEGREIAQAFRKRLAIEMRLEARSEYSNIPKKFKVTLLEKINPHNSGLPHLASKAPALTLGQTSKGVGVMLAMNQKMDAMSQEMRKSFDKLPVRMTKEISGLRQETRKGFDRMSKDAAGLRQETRKGFDRMSKDTASLRTDVRRGFDKLPWRIAKAIKSAY